MLVPLPVVGGLRERETERGGRREKDRERERESEGVRQTGRKKERE